MKKLLGPLVAVVVTVGILWVAKELKGLGSFEFGILDGDDLDEEDDHAAEQFEADVVTQTGMNFGDWLQSPEGERALSGFEESVEDVQRYGDYAEALTLADLEGISTPDLTTIVENLKRDTMNPVDKSVVDMVSTWATTDPASLHEQRMMSLNQDVVDDFVIDEPVVNVAFIDPDGPFLEDGPYKGYPLSEPRLRTPAPSPTAEAPGDVSTVWADEIRDAIGIEPEPYGAQLASQPKD